MKKCLIADIQKFLWSFSNRWCFMLHGSCSIFGFIITGPKTHIFENGKVWWRSTDAAAQWQVICSFYFTMSESLEMTQYWWVIVSSPCKIHCRNKSWTEIKFTKLTFSRSTEGHAGSNSEVAKRQKKRKFFHLDIVTPFRLRMKKCSVSSTGNLGQVTKVMMSRSIQF